MEVRRFGDALLRSQASPLAFLTPSVSSRCPRMAQRALKTLHKNGLQRYSVTNSRSAGLTTSASNPAENQTTQKPSKSPDWLSSEARSSRTNKFSSHRARAENRTSSPRATRSERLMNKGNSADDLLSTINSLAGNRPFSRDIDIDKMAQPGPMLQVEDLMASVNDGLGLGPPPRPAMRLTPTTGRTIEIGGNIDVGRGFKLLEQNCGKNKVKQDFNRQRFHERPGLKRKRLKSVRWRNRFMEGFRATVSRVKQLKTQGW